MTICILPFTAGNLSTFDQIKPGARLKGLDPAGIAEVVQVARFGADALNIVFRVDGRVGERLLYRSEEIGFEFIKTGRSYAFEADGGLLRLPSEGYPIRLAHLFDSYLAVTASQIEALPHQITGVYGEMLPRQPLRFLLADDPGAGKTIMAGLLIKELLIRGDLERCLIVAPGNLVEQWQDEMAEKFGLGFDAVTRDQIEASITGNPFVERNRLILRLDMAARSEELKAKLSAAPEWDLVICDETHRMAASYFGGGVKETQRYKLGKLLGTRTRNLLLMSATPHNGKEADFQLFMGLLDADRFEGRSREGVHKADVSDMLRRLIKEELYRMDGTPLFPERRAYTAGYALSPEEVDLYQAVTTYVRNEMNRADRSGDGNRRTSVGFALQILQRRLASSPAAIHRSLERRRKRLEERLREERLFRGGLSWLARSPALPSYDPDDLEEAPGEEQEAAEEQILDSATAAQTLAELEAEIALLKDLEETLGGETLSTRLAELWPADRPHLPVAEVADWFSTYVYLPKLRDRVVLETAIRDALAKLDPKFAYAEGFDEATAGYLGLLWQKASIGPIPPTALLVRPEPAIAQLRATAPMRQPDSGSTLTGGGAGATPPTEPAPITNRQPQRFFGSVDIDIVRPVRAFEAILNAVVAELHRTNGAKVKLTLEIEADAEDGFSEADIGVVRDNARQLKFKPESTGFE